jgi:Pyruvate/2-oxoacid:ferredoxin oxidoreductase delta subunit
LSNFRTLTGFNFRHRKKNYNLTIPYNNIPVLKSKEENRGRIWDSLYIYYISGTGNARISSEWIAEEASARGLKTVVQSIDRLEGVLLPEKGENALIGFAFPTHGFNAAPIMLRFIAGFPQALTRNIFLLNTRAGMKLYKIFTPGLSGLALLLPAFILRLKGYRCIACRPVDLPSNWIPLHPGLKQKVIDSIFKRCERIVRSFANRILSGEKVYRGLLSLPVDIAIGPIAFGYYFAGRFFLSKTFIAGSKCNNCGLCIKECPTSSIKMVNDRPYWKLTCESCMRCLNHCPTKAIEAAHGMAVGFYLLIVLVNAWIGIALISLFKTNTGSGWWIAATQVTSLALTIIIPLIIYRIMHYAMGFTPVRQLVRFSSLTALPFWRRYKSSNRKNKA